MRLRGFCLPVPLVAVTGAFVLGGCATKPFGAPPAAYEQPASQKAAGGKTATPVRDGVESSLVGLTPLSGAGAVIVGAAAATMSLVDGSSKRTEIAPIRDGSAGGN